MSINLLIFVSILIFSNNIYNKNIHIIKKRKINFQKGKKIFFLINVRE